MRSRQRSRAFCGCSRTLQFSSTLLFLSLILPTSSYAQITLTLVTSSPSSTANPTLTTSTPPLTPATPPQDPTLSSSPPPPSPTLDTTNTNIDDNVFHYYFLIIAVVAILLLLCVLYIGRRKKRKAEMIRSRSQRALARDVEGFRSRFGTGRIGLGFNNGPIHRNPSDIEEGLDARGEAPPPYVPGSKPPSLRSVDGTRRPSTTSEHRVGGSVELILMNGDVEHPPGYHEYPADGSDIGITRPGTVVTASETLRSTRRVLSSSGQEGTVIW